MSVSYFIRYEGEKSVTDELIAHYRNLHIPLLLRLPGIQAVHLHLSTNCNDPLDISPGKTSLLAQLEFDSISDLENALGSKERMAARADFREFPTFDGSITHQAMETASFVFTS